MFMIFSLIDISSNLLLSNYLDVHESVINSIALKEMTYILSAVLQHRDQSSLYNMPSQLFMAFCKYLTGLCVLQGVECLIAVSSSILSEVYFGTMNVVECNLLHIWLFSTLFAANQHINSVSSASPF